MPLVLCRLIPRVTILRECRRQPKNLVLARFRAVLALEIMLLVRRRRPRVRKVTVFSSEIIVEASNSLLISPFRGAPAGGAGIGVIQGLTVGAVGVVSVVLSVGAALGLVAVEVLGLLLGFVLSVVRVDLLFLSR